MNPIICRLCAVPTERHPAEETGAERGQSLPEVLLYPSNDRAPPSKPQAFLRALS